jgi:hypothetical protein
MLTIKTKIGASMMTRVPRFLRFKRIVESHRLILLLVVVIKLFMSRKLIQHHQILMLMFIVLILRP